ncbi:hypothetical protein VP1G_01978 [Cytospora mali]|uniref:Heterokaryon incompatibility domain-containing protein n=1 Tax=Cytospora mali TaxID=578113 RepID=A0A194USD8_CYTMA|nr:hypothetical protein VP1G_01978 [Valsa mali var. pyri (nom. inval.)]
MSTAHIPNSNPGTENFDPNKMSQDDTITAAPQTPSPGLTLGPASDPIHEATQTAPTPTNPPWTQFWLPWRPKPVAEILDQNLARRFRGKWGLYNIHHVSWPRKPDGTNPETLAGGYTEAKDWNNPQGEVIKTPEGKYTYRNKFHQDRNKYMDNAVCLSPTHARPRRLVIRTRIKGNIPIVLKIAEWSLARLKGDRWWNKVNAAWRVFFVSVPLQVMLASPWVLGWDDGDTENTYTDFPGYYWDWPWYAINVLDEAPGPDGMPKRMGRRPADGRGRSIRPSKIVIHKGNDEWVVVDAKDYPSVRYIFISYGWKQFGDEDQVKRMARAITKEKGYKAYWLDRQCIHQPDGLEKDDDVYTMCDIVRSSGLVTILLSKDTEQARIDWGSRLWALPEGMLAPGDSVIWCHETSSGVLHHDEAHKVELTSTFWGEPDGERYEGGSPIRILAEHCSNLLTQPPGAPPLHHLAYAVMGFLHYRLERNEDDTLFQNLARLSLSNDSDRIIERMISILPKASG